MLELEVLESNADARAVYDRWGFEPVERRSRRRSRARAALAPDGRADLRLVHVQTDDAGAVKRDAAKVLALRAGREVDGNWVRVRSDATDATRRARRRSRGSSRTRPAGVVLALGVEDGAVVRYDLYDRGATVDEYLSVPEYFGPLPPATSIALGANPTVVARLTGADPARVREVARTAASPGELPPAQELYEQIATVMGVQP